MKKLLILSVMALLALSVMPAVFAVSVGTGLSPDISTEKFAPRVWMCDNRVVYDDATEPGRISLDGQTLVERINNYAFEGEQISWDVLVMDKNKIDQNIDVYATLGDVQGEGNDIEVNCIRTDDTRISSCNARIQEENIDEFDSDIMSKFTCTLTVETPESMYGQYWITVEAQDGDGLMGTMDENEYWFLNPEIALSIGGELTFDEVRPGSVSYSDTILVGNDAEEGSGVLLDMFISGTDFYDPASSGAKCPTSNRLKLSRDLRSQASLGFGTASGATFSTDCNADSGGLTGVDNNDHLCYFATSGAYSTIANPNADAEGYKPIVYSDAFTRDFYNDAEIIWNGLLLGYSAGNVLTPGAEIAVTFKLGLPEPCVGDFSDGDIYFWGEAI